MAGKEPKDPAAVSLGRRGGKVGGRAKVPKGTSMLSKKERVARAKAAAKARWRKD
jgi:hypothetical protein